MTARSASKAAATIALAVVVGALTACQPAPPDGRDLGIEPDRGTVQTTADRATTFTVRVRNHGTTATATTSIVIVAPTGLGATASVPGGTCTSVPLDDHRTAIACSIGGLGRSAYRTVTIALAPTGPGRVAEIGLEVASDGTEPTADPHPNKRVLPVEVRTPGEVDLLVFPQEEPSPRGGSSFLSIAHVANDGPPSTSEVTVTQRFPSSVHVESASFARHDGAASGACTTTPGLVSCTAGSELIGSSSSGDQFWTMRLDLTPADDEDFPIEVEVSSPRDEPWPDENVNALLLTHLGPTSEALPFWPAPRMPIGAEVTLSAQWPRFIADVQNVTVTVPEGYELRYVGLGGSDECIGTGTVTCPYETSGASDVTFTFRALAPSGPVRAEYSIATATGEVSGPLYLWAR